MLHLLWPLGTRDSGTVPLPSRMKAPANADDCDGEGSGDDGAGGNDVGGMRRSREDVASMHMPDND